MCIRLVSSFSMRPGSVGGEFGRDCPFAALIVPIWHFKQPKNAHGGTPTTALEALLLYGFADTAPKVVACAGRAMRWRPALCRWRRSLPALKRPSVRRSRPVPCPGGGEGCGIPVAAAPAPRSPPAPKAAKADAWTLAVVEGWWPRPFRGAEGHCEAPVVTPGGSGPVPVAGQRAAKEGAAGMAHRLMPPPRLSWTGGGHEHSSTRRPRPLCQAAADR